MAKKIKHHHKKSSWIPNSLEDPVHNVVGYAVLLILAIVVLYVVLNLRGGMGN